MQRISVILEQHHLSTLRRQIVALNLLAPSPDSGELHFWVLTCRTIFIQGRKGKICSLVGEVATARQVERGRLKISSFCVCPKERQRAHFEVATLAMLKRQLCWKGCEVLAWQARSSYWYETDFAWRPLMPRFIGEIISTPMFMSNCTF